MEEKQLSIYNDHISSEEKMSIYDIAVSFRVTPRTIQRYVEKYFPLSVKNGVKTMLNEQQVTFIKLKIQEAKNLDRVVELPKTDLEKELLIQQAMILQADKIEGLQKLADEQKKKLEEAQPKIEFHDRVGDSTGLLNIGQTAKTLGTGRTRMFVWLRDEDIFFGREPYQKYIDQGYFKVKTTESNGHIQKQAFTTPKGLIWLQKRFK
jgi:phage antirepressor YoqD-like protein